MRHEPGLDEEPLRKILPHFTYKKGWTFLIQDGMLSIKFYAPNTDDPEKIVPVQSATPIPRFRTPDFPWADWLLREIIEVERHEAREFFKINGVKVFDPHG